MGEDVEDVLLSLVNVALFHEQILLIKIAAFSLSTEQDREQILKYPRWIDKMKSKAQVAVPGIALFFSYAWGYWGYYYGIIDVFSFLLLVFLCCMQYTRTMFVCSSILHLTLS